MSAIQQPNGTRYDNYWRYERKLHQPYDYRHKGLLNRLMSHKIWQTKNPILSACLNVFESNLLLILGYADELWNYQNYRFHNR